MRAVEILLVLLKTVSYKILRQKNHLAYAWCLVLPNYLVQKFTKNVFVWKKKSLSEV